MRICLVYDCLYPQTIGGIEHRSAQLAAALAERGHQVTVVGMGEPAPPRDGVEILTLGPRPSDGASRGARHTARIAIAPQQRPHLVLRRDEFVHEVGADETRAAGDKTFHSSHGPRTLDLL